MASKENYLEKQNILKLLEEARELREAYDAENKRNPQGFYKHGSVDNIAIRLMERRDGIFFTGIKLHGEDAVLYAHEGSVADSGELLFNLPGSEVYTVANFRGTTVARFILTLCEVIESRRSIKGTSEFVAPHAHASSTKKIVHHYT